MSGKEIAVSLAWLHHEVSIDLKNMKKIQRKMGQITKNKKEMLKSYCCKTIELSRAII